MIKLIQNLFGGDSNDREVKKLWPLVEEINAEYDSIKHISDEELQAKTPEFKKFLAQKLTVTSVPNLSALKLLISPS